MGEDLNVTSMVMFSNLSESSCALQGLFFFYTTGGSLSILMQNFYEFIAT